MALLVVCLQPLWAQLPIVKLRQGLSCHEFILLHNKLISSSRSCFQWGLGLELLTRTIIVTIFLQLESIQGTPSGILHPPSLEIKIVLIVPISSQFFASHESSFLLHLHCSDLCRSFRIFSSRHHSRPAVFLQQARVQPNFLHYIM